MKKLRTAFFASAMAAFTVAEAQADCTLYQHRDYGGSHWTLSDYDRMIMTEGESYGCTTNGHGGGCESVIYDPSWNDQVSSFRVTNGCTLTLLEDIGDDDPHFRSSGSYKYVGGDWNDEASEAYCSCN